MLEQQEAGAVTWAERQSNCLWLLIDELNGLLSHVGAGHVTFRLFYCSGLGNVPRLQLTLYQRENKLIVVGSAQIDKTSAGGMLRDSVKQRIRRSRYGHVNKAPFITENRFRISMHTRSMCPHQQYIHADDIHNATHTAVKLGDKDTGLVSVGPIEGMLLPLCKQTAGRDG